ncbi:MAG: hypothetical protein KF699_15820 [Phycisphaeraceae bacterium]|nr:hypothetical protein [Phycisphaeraceae bacterium]
MLLWPANSWLFWVAVAIAFALAMRFGLFPAQGANVSRRRIAALLILAAGAVVAVIVLPMLAFATATDSNAGSPLDFAMWTGAIFLGVLALLVATWALFADSARGRKRCPKCWYDMSASPALTCPECGTTAKSPAALLRTRRHWRVLLVAAVVLALSAAAAVGPNLRAGRGFDLVPDLVMVALCPYVSGGNRFSRAIDERIGDEATSRGVGPEGSVRRWVMLRSARTAIASTDSTIVFRGLCIFTAAGRDVQGEVPRLLELVNGMDAAVTNYALLVLWQCADENEEARAALIASLDSSNRRTVAISVGFLWPRSERSGVLALTPEVEQLGAHSNPLVRADVLRRAVSQNVHDPVTLRLFQAALVDEAPVVRATALRIAGAQMKPPADFQQHVARGLSDPTPMVQHAAAWALIGTDYPDSDLWALVPGILGTMGAGDATYFISMTMTSSITETKVRTLLDVAAMYPVLRRDVNRAFAHCREFQAELLPLLRSAAAAWRSGEDEPNARALEDIITLIEDDLRMRGGGDIDQGPEQTEE